MGLKVPVIPHYRLNLEPYLYCTGFSATITDILTVPVEDKTGKTLINLFENPYHILSYGSWHELQYQWPIYNITFINFCTFHNR